jgi:hypothetical protein
MALTTPFDPQEQASRIRAQIKARPDLISAEHRTLALRAALAETSDTSEGVAVLQALVLQMDEEQAQLEQSVGRMSVLVANKEALIGKLIQAVKDLKTLKFGKRSEKMSPDQLALALEDVVVTADALQAQIDRIDAEAAVISGSSTPDQEKAARKRREPGGASGLPAAGSSGPRGDHPAAEPGLSLLQRRSSPDRRDVVGSPGRHPGAVLHPPHDPP